MTTMKGRAGTSILQRRNGLALKIRSDARSTGTMTARQYAGIVTVIMLNMASQASLYNAFMCPPQEFGHLPGPGIPFHVNALLFEFFCEYQRRRQGQPRHVI